MADLNRRQWSEGLLVACLAAAAATCSWAGEAETLDQLFAQPGEQSEEQGEERPDEQRQQTPDETYAETIPVGEESQGEPVSAARARRPIIEEIVVTATKRDLALRDVAASVSAFSGEAMENASLKDVNDIVEAVPGVNAWESQNGTATKITVRGISAAGPTTSTTGIFLGETPFNDADGARVTLDMNPFDLRSVEVLKGPVGTLFGGSGLNGAIRYMPQPPVLDESEVKAFVDYRSVAQGGDSPTYGAAVNVPLLDDRLALRLVGFDRKTAGYLDSEHPEYQSQDINSVSQDGLRALLRWTPMERLRIDAMAVDQSTHVDDVLSYTERMDGSLVRSITPRASPSDSEYQVYFLSGNWAFDWADLVVNASRLDKAQDSFVDFSYLTATEDSPPPTGTAAALSSSEGSSDVYELRLVSNTGAGAWDWLVGIFDYQYDVLTDDAIAGSNAALPEPGTAGSLLAGITGLTIVDDNGDVPLLVSRIDSIVSERALFGEVNWRFLPRFQATVGLRLYRFQYDKLFSTEGAGCVLIDPAGCPQSELELDAKESGISPKFSLQWQNDSLLTYLTLTRGFRFGGSNSASHPEIPLIYESDTLWNLEGGVRADWLDRSLITDLAVYAIRWEDAQVESITSDGSSGYVDNVGQVSGHGAEATITWRTPLQGLSLSLVPAYTDLRTDAPYVAGSGAEVPAGTRWPLAPRWQTSTSLNWDGLIAGAGLRAQLTHLYQGRAHQQIGDAQTVFGYSTYNLQFVVELPQFQANPSISLNINNLSDVRGVTFRRGSTAASPPVMAYATPRNASLRLAFSF